MMGSRIPLIVSLLLALAAQQGATQSPCLNPNQRPGYCISIYDCSSLTQVLQRNQLTGQQREFLVNSQCSNGPGRWPYVCCTADQNYDGAATGEMPTTTTRRPITHSTQPGSRSTGSGNQLPQPPQCGRLTLSQRIYNGNDTALDEYPWMALVGYRKSNGQISYNCGGSLINQRYIVTAAHCVTGPIETDVGPATLVRLGEYDLSSDVDCIDNDCNDKVLEVPVEETIPYPAFDASAEDRHHDIALIRLANDVSYTDFISPICLPLQAISRTAGAPVAGEKLTVAGWGRTLLSRKSNVKQHLRIPVVATSACARKFESKNIRIMNSQLCAGGEFARDSCDGDSGGPLMRNVESLASWVLEGIVSFGNRCGLQGWPGVYTRTSEYMDWIQQMLRP